MKKPVVIEGEQGKDHFSDTLPKKEKKKLSKKQKTVLTVVTVFLALLISVLAYKQTVRGKLLTSVIYFTEHTLKSRDYIAYDIDIMELCRDYINSDLTFEGRAYLNDIEGFGFSSTMSVDGKRSFAQKQLVGHADMDVFFLNIGEFDFYAKDDTVYMVVPMLDDLSYGFRMDAELFGKAPEFSSDIDKEWFRAHAMDIWNFIQSIRVEETGETIDDDGVISTEYRITIPQGQGAFIYELLGVTAPDFDVVADLYLTTSGHFRRLEMDLGEAIPNTEMIIDGTDVGTVIFRKKLPLNESMETIMKRVGDYTYTNYIAIESYYYTSKDTVLSSTSHATWNHIEDGFTLEISDLKVYKDDELQMMSNFIGTVRKDKYEEDIIEAEGVDLGQIRTINWTVLRSDVKGFIEEVIQTAKDIIW